MRRSRWSRGVALLFMAVWAVSRGAQYAPGSIARARVDVPIAIQLVTEGLPLTVTGYGMLWIVAAGAAVVGAFLERDTWAFYPVLLMGTFAGAAFTLSWVGSLFLPYGGADVYSAGLYVGTTGALIASLRGRRRRRTVSRGEVGA